MAYKKLVINGEEYPLPSKVSDLDNDVGFIAPNDMGQVDISGSTVNIAGGSVTIGETTYGLSVSGNVIKEVGAPEADTDGANKKYVDDAIANIDIPDVPITSDEWSLTISKDFITIEAYDSINLTAQNSLSLHVENDMSLSATTIYVSGDMQVQAPTGNSSAVNKKYVDDAIASLKALLNLQ